MKKLIYNLTILCFSFCLVGMMNGQTIGVQIGADFANQDIDDGFFGKGDVISTDGMFSPMGGVFVNLPVSGNFSIRPGVDFSQGGFQIEQDGTTGRRRIFYVGVNGNVQFMSNLPGPVNFIGRVGPNVRMAIGGKDNFDIDTDDTEDINIGNDDGDHVKELDIGAAVEAGVKHKRLQLVVNYGMGFVNVLPDNWDPVEAKNHSIGIRIGYDISGD